MEGVKELIERKRQGGFSDRYLADLDGRLNRFAKDFNTTLSRITTSQIQRWLDSLGLSSQSVKNYSTVLHLFFEHCRVRGYIPPGSNPVSETERVDARQNEVEIFEPSEFIAILKHAEPGFRPCIALQGLAGLRSGELQRLEWSDIDLARSVIVVSKGVAKTASRRTIPIGSALKGWLQNADRPGEKVWCGGHHEFYSLQRRAAKAAKVKWKHNGDIAMPATGSH